MQYLVNSVLESNIHFFLINQVFSNMNRTKTGGRTKGTLTLPLLESRIFDYIRINKSN